MQFRDYSFGFHTLGEGFSSVVYKARKYKSSKKIIIFRTIVRNQIYKTRFFKSGIRKKPPFQLN
jgi:hypothetical protein